MQALQLANRLRGKRVIAVYSSPLERALETAEPIARNAGVAVQTSDAFGEIHFGEWTGRTLEELAPLPEWQRFNTQRSTTRIPGGELMLEVQARVLSELQGLQTTYPEQTVAVVSHGDVIRAAVAHYAGIPLDLLSRFEISPASVSVVEVNEHGPRIVSLNDTGEFGAQ